ncbi:MAG TPA: DNA-binding protein WhiA [Clostridiales bacterium]|nr:DNA-binding protein WhiA [Clostridiales bacterium]
MSFSQEVKEELSKISNLANKQEVKLEFLGYLTSSNISDEKNYIRFSTENEYNIDRYAKLIRNINIEDFKIDVNGKTFFIDINKKKLEALEKFDFNTEKIEDIRPFIRGIFMGSGSINNPEKKYHLECGIKEEKDILKTIYLLRRFDINFKSNNKTIYTKEGEEISKFLAFIGANKAVLKFEEIRVQRHMNNKVNRLVNCKSANLNKVLNASVEQINAIKKLKETGQFEKLNDSLKEIAELRLEFPDISLVELGQKLSIPIGKSGVNYRLNKIIKISEE